jgi:hypothetical protein
MANQRVATIHPACFAFASLLFALIACFAQTNTAEIEPGKLSDAAIRWQFNTHG